MPLAGSFPVNELAPCKVGEFVLMSKVVIIYKVTSRQYTVNAKVAG